MATLGVVEYESPVIFDTMQPKAKVAMTVRALQSQQLSECRCFRHSRHGATQSTHLAGGERDEGGCSRGAHADLRAAAGAGRRP